MVENGVRKERPRTGISRGNDRDAICAFKFAPSRHAFDLHTFLRLTRALCWSLVVEGSVVRSWFLSNCSTCVPVAAPGITGSPSKRICRGTLSHKTRNWSVRHTAHCYVALRGPACARLCSGKLACTFSLSTCASSSVPSLRFLASISSLSFLAPR